MVQNVENRFPLNSVDSNQQLHEFQVVHAIITCRKNSQAEESTRNNNNNHNGSDVHPVDGNMNRLKKRSSSSKEERSSFVSTICRTFNALAQATNPSLCAKQNNSRPVTIASTVKNIISQFSRQSYHNPLCLASPCEASPRPSATRPRSSTTPPRTTHVRNVTVPKKAVVVKAKTVSGTASSLLSQSPANKNVTRVQKLKEDSSPKTASSNATGTTSKTKSVRARNAHRLTRHQSAPIPHPSDEKDASKTSVSVRRSKSDLSSYSSFYRRSQRKIDSNVQTKVLHFENCCKDKRRAAMCVECRKHSLEQDVAAQSKVLPVTPKTDTTKEKTENFVGALSYHKPSTISQSPVTSGQNVSGATNSNVSSNPADNSKSPKPGPPTLPRPKAVVCPGGTYFPSTIVKQPTVPVNPLDGSVTPPEVMASSTTSGVTITEESPMSSTSLFCGLAESSCSQMKRKHSSSEEDDNAMQCKKESRETDFGNTGKKTMVLCNNVAACDNHEQISLERTVENNTLFSQQQTPPPREGEDLYSLLCNLDNEGTSSSVEGDRELSVSKDLDCKSQLSDDSSDSFDSSSSSGESCLSPRQDYLVRRRGTGSLRRRPSSHFQRMRRKLKRRISSRPRSYPEAMPMDYSSQLESQIEQERRFLESIRIPAPNFMVCESSQSSFSARRQQLAMHFGSKDWMSMLPDHVMSKIFAYLDTRTLASLKCVCEDFRFVIENYDIRGTDSLWVKDKRYIEDPCKYCRKRFTYGDQSMCRFHAKSYHCDLPYGRSYWMCCFKIERNAPGCRTGIHNNHWGTSPAPKD